MKVFPLILWGCFELTLFCECQGTMEEQRKGSGLIMNNNKAGRGKYPFYAVIRYRNVPTCSGTIVNFEYILTTASCVRHDLHQRYGVFKVTVGETTLKRKNKSEQDSYIADIILHRNTSTINDLALLRLRTRLEYTNHVHPVRFENETHAQNLQECYQIGFGLDRPDIKKPSNSLQEIPTTVITRKKCQRLNKKLMGGKASDIKSNYICSQDPNVGICASDKGAPLICFDENGNSKQAGVLSFGSQKCIDGFNVFMRIPRYLDWIHDTTSKVWKF